MNPEEKQLELLEPAVNQEAVQTVVNLEDNLIQANEKKKNKDKKIVIIILVVLFIATIVGGSLSFFYHKPKAETEITENNAKEVYSQYRISSNSLENFDLYFLKLENFEKNKVYSPLSIKYALEMLAEGAGGETKAQLDAVIGNYKAISYPNSEHMSFANAMFIRNSFKDVIKSSYIDTLKEKYNAEVVLDSFASASPMNDWASNKTFNLINNLFEDDTVKNEDFILTNALAIDMDWNHQIQPATGSEVPYLNYSITYKHEKYETDGDYHDGVAIITSEDQFYPLTFNGKENIKAVCVRASFNRYDAIKEIGEDKIREEVGAAYKEWLKTYEVQNRSETETDVDKYLDKYIKELDSNYNKEGYSTDFMLYNDDNVKAFAKDLKTYDDITLQYIGIMPKEESLDKYIEVINAKDINKIIDSLREMKIENFKDGVVTLIKGYIPLFKYDYELNFIEDLNKLGIKDVFDINKANLSSMLSNGAKQYINDASHAATIEFSNDGIKAAAFTQMGGSGAASGGFNYLYEIPVEEIDMTFDKPYMYIIRDKSTGEVWFTGTVYEPIERSIPKDSNGYYDY